MNTDNCVFENYDALIHYRYWQDGQLHLLDVLKYEECRATLRDALKNGFENSEAYFWVVEREDRDGFYPLPLIFQEGTDAPEAWRLHLRDSILAVLA